MDKTKDLVDKLTSPPSSSEKIVNIKDIYVIRFKEGPILRSVNIKASSFEEAESLRDAYVQHLYSRDNKKIVPVGKPEPFAIDVMDEIAKWNKKNSSSSIGTSEPLVQGDNGHMVNQTHS